MQERAGDTVGFRLAKRLYPESLTYVAAGASVTNLLGLPESNPSTATVLASFGVAIGSAVAVVANNRKTYKHIEGELKRIDPIEPKKQFVREQMSKLYNYRLAYAGSGFIGFLATDNVPIVQRVVAATAGLTIYSITEERMTRVGKQIVTALKKPFDYPDDWNGEEYDDV